VEFVVVTRVFWAPIAFLLLQNNKRAPIFQVLSLLQIVAAVLLWPLPYNWIAYGVQLIISHYSSSITVLVLQLSIVLLHTLRAMLQQNSNLQHVLITAQTMGSVLIFLIVTAPTSQVLDMETVRIHIKVKVVTPNTKMLKVSAQLA